MKSHPNIGDRFGTLELAAVADVDIRRGVIWLCRCECGATTQRTTSSLSASKAAGYVSSCYRCVQKRRETARSAAHGMAHSAFAMLWHTARTLYDADYDARETARLLELSELNETVSENDCKVALEHGEDGPCEQYGMTLAEIAVALGGVSVERVRQIEQGALRKLRGRMFRQPKPRSTYPECSGIDAYGACP